MDIRITDARLLTALLTALTALTSLTTTTSAAQPPPAPVTQSGPLGIPGLPFQAEFNMLWVAPFASSDPVLDAPYSGEIMTELTQTLADGNRIERRAVATVARDSRGRQRREEPLVAIGPMLGGDAGRIVTISDPVAGTYFSLDPVRRVAVRTHQLVAGGIRSGGRHVLTVTGGDISSETRVEQLGSKEIEGIRADGVRTTMTLPAGAIGNQRPIDVVSEEWFSTELRVVVLSTRSDPRAGDMTYRLTNVVRGEPAPELFQVPADYQIQDMKPLPDIQQH
jgi:hypothetical protein